MKHPPNANAPSRSNTSIERGSSLPRLQATGASVSVDPDGGRLASFVLRGVERLVQPIAEPSRLAPILWGSFLMLPWVGRMENARLTWGGRDHHFAPNLGRHALHGVGFDRAWHLCSDETTAHLSLDLEAAGWPFGGHAQQTIELMPERLIQTAIVGAGTRSMPVSLGWHPWFLRPESGDLRLRLPSVGTLVTDTELIPTGSIAPLNAVTDFRQGKPIGQSRLDHTYVDVREASVEWPDVELHLEFGKRISSAVVHTRNHAVCVEPQTAWPNAAALHSRGLTGTGLAVLEPGEQLVAEQTWTWHLADPDHYVSDEGTEL
jgi:aldose 1-epimerase